jgi:ligand-binding SRPBCC domain-containing protein
MTIIQLETTIDAPIEICFNLSRSAELHMISTSKTNEYVVNGRNTGLFELNDTVTWRARHFGIFQTLGMKITEMNFPYSFEDRMLNGAFKSICHKHSFKTIEDGTLMTDTFMYEVPFGAFGSLFDKIILKSYMTKLLKERNEVIKNYAETGKGRELFD